MEGVIWVSRVINVSSPERTGGSRRRRSGQDGVHETSITYIKGMKRVTVEYVRQFVNNKLLKADVAGLLVKKHGLKIPVSCLRVPLMIKSECTYDGARHSCYAGGHIRP